MSSFPFAQLSQPRAFARDQRFLDIPDMPRAAVGDPAADAFQRGYAQGIGEAQENAAAEASAQDAQRRRIEIAFSRMDEQAAAQLRERLHLTVLALCEEAVAPLAIDPQGLALRVERAVAMLQRSQDERRVLLNPEDYRLVAAHLPAELTVEPDQSVERGGLRIATSDGGIEDGPSQWRRLLAEAFREC